MRLHRLSMSAVGPYAGVQEIDFDRFAASGRFLLTGPTGSGKSMIIDAIVFALFGDVAGEKDSTKSRMRSRLAAPEVDTWVELDFSTAMGMYRIRRSPAFMRPKKRGEGLTEQKAAQSLFRLEGPEHTEAVPITQRADEVGREIARIVGLSRSQFIQTVVLPQGKFAKFLRSSSAERHDVLRDVFGTQLFDDLQSELKSRAHDAQVATSQARTELRASGHSLTQVLQGAPEGACAQVDEATAALNALLENTDIDSEALSGLLDALGQEARTATQDAQQAQDQALHARTAAATHREEQANLARLLQERAALLDAQALLLGQAREIACQEEELAAARRAEIVTAAAQALDAAHERTLQAARHAEERYAALPEGLSNTEDLSAAAVGDELRMAVHASESSSSHQDAPDAATLAPLTARALRWLTEQARDRHDRAAALGEVVALEAGLTSERAQCEKLAADCDALEATIAEHSSALEALPEKKSLVEKDLQEARGAHATLPVVDTAAAQARERLGAAEQVEALAAQIVTAQSALTAAGETAREAADEDARLRRAWIAATAATLVGELCDGQPCPVCGSPDHPAPAPLTAQAISRAQLEQSHAQLRSAEEALSQAREVHDRARRDHDHALAAAQGLSVAAAREALDAAEQARTEAHNAAGALASIEQRLEELDRQQSSLATALSQAREQRSACEASLQAARTLLAQHEERVTQARGESASVAAQQEALSLEGAVLDTAAQALSQAQDTLTACQRAAEALRVSLTEQGFESRSAQQDALRSPERRELLSRNVTAYRAEQLRVTQGLAREDIARLSGTETPDVEGATRAAQEAEAAWTQATQHASEVATYETSLQRARTALSERFDSLQQAIGSSAALLRVAALAAGDNSERTPLSIWVLSERFRDVVSFANARLAHMSRGRYELIQTNEEEQSARNRGLGLAVIDHQQNDAQRDPKSLSGGETFYVSLALALALGDVVTSESGGITMETLFVDEGFGTLDPETLECVLAELSRLQEGGRMVGIVSHVEELRRQIADQIQVRTTTAGSTLRLVAS